MMLFNPRSVPRAGSRLLAKRSGSTAPEVRVAEGRLRGARAPSVAGPDYFGFKGIPYAEPPVGKLRFKAPLPVRPWGGVLDAVEHGPVCPQLTPTRDVREGSENCLFLNVYTPSLNTDSKMPVMVFIHGGGFLMGSGDDDLHGPDFLLQHDVILVTVNYRLEAFGFLCLDTPEVPGNAGLRDQVVALRWIKNNIRQFGGDPENVTIFGESAGGASVAYHMLSPMSEGLFDKAICQSGVCLHDWAFQKHGRARAFRAGRKLGKDTDDPEELLRYLQSVPARELVGIHSKIASEEESRRVFKTRFAPVVEKRFPNVDPFICESPLRSLSSGSFRRVPFVVGYNSREGLSVAPSIRKKIAIANEHPSFLLPTDIAEGVPRDQLDEYGERIKAFYLKGRDFNSDDVDLISDMTSDLHYIFGIYRMADAFAAACPSIYMYKFHLSTELNVFKSLLGLADYEGACHVDELFYMFKNPFNADIYEANATARDHVHTMTKMWTDFAKTGAPSAAGEPWPRYTARHRRLLAIAPRLAVRAHVENESLTFWRALYAAVEGRATAG